MKYNLKARYILLPILVVFTLSSCSDDLLIERPPNIITADNLFADVAGFETALNGVYSLVRLDREGLSSVNDLRAEVYMNGTDNMLTNHRSGGYSRMAMDWEERNGPLYGNFERHFNWLYQVVNATNTIITRAETADDRLGDKGVQISAEAHFLRAWAYRYLAYMWGDVPIKLDESTGATIRTDWERAPVMEVWEQVKADLLIAEASLPIEPEVAGKPGKGAAQHYLSEISLVLNQPEEALEWADKCIGTPEYQLITERYGVMANQPGVPFMDMFIDGNSNRSEGNTEALWIWQWENLVIGGGRNIMRRYHISRYNDIKVKGKSPLEITVERGGRPRARMSITQWALGIYEPEDDRGSQYAVRKFFILKDANENDTGIADDLPDGFNFGDTIFLKSEEPITASSRNRRDWPFSRKWDSADPLDINGAAQYDDQAYLRLGETYLLKAEAQLKTGDAQGAAETINVLRERSNASAVTAGEIDIDFILDERSRELVVEEQRRFTLLRTNKWLERTRAYNTNGGSKITERDRLFPIPQSVIDANLTLDMEQNPGY